MTISMKNIAFIINPISGTHSKRKLPKLIEKTLDHTQFAFDIVFTQYKGHATEIAGQYVKLGFDAVVAVGGDGTVNEVASALRHTNTALGIIPIGSGNGLARHLKIPIRTEKAIRMLNHSETIKIDYGMENDQPFFCTCGTGFDAFISSKFANAGKRGLLTYIEQMISGYFNYKAENYHLTGEKIDIEAKAFVITFANASQWGNNAYIAPQASIQDGIMNVAIMSQFPLVLAPSLALQLFTKTIDKDMFMNTVKTQEITLHRENPGVFHYDGEPTEEGTEIRIRIIPEGLNVLVEKRF